MYLSILGDCESQIVQRLFPEKSCHCEVKMGENMTWARFQEDEEKERGQEGRGGSKDVRKNK